MIPQFVAQREGAYDRCNIVLTYTPVVRRSTSGKAPPASRLLQTMRTLAHSNRPPHGRGSRWPTKPLRTPLTAVLACRSSSNAASVQQCWPAQPTQELQTLLFQQRCRPPRARGQRQSPDRSR